MDETQSFDALVKQCIASGIGTQQLSDEFAVSVSTINRWRTGKSAPRAGTTQETVRRRLTELCAKQPST